MKKKTKIIFFLILLLIATSLLSACNGNGNAANTPTTQATQVTLPNLGKFVSVIPKSSDIDYTNGNEIAKQKIIETIANDKGSLIDFEVIELSQDDFTNELNELLSTSTYIDSITTNYDMLATYADIGLIKPIDSLLNSYGSNLLNAIDESYWEDVKYNGQIYAIPSIPYEEESLMIARGDTLAQLTTESITSYSELLSICKFYKMAGYEYPLAVTWDQLIDIFANSFNVSPSAYTHDSDTNAFIMREQTSAYVNWFLKEAKLLYDNGYLHPNLFTATEEQMKAEFMAGRSAIYVAEYDNLLDDRKTLKSAFPNAELRLITPLTTRHRSYHLLSGEEKIDTVLMFTANSQNSEALITYLDWAYTSQLNHEMIELGAYGEQLMYDPSKNEYKYVDDYSLENKPYGGVYTLGLSTDLLYTSPTYVNMDNDIFTINELQKEIHTYLSETECSTSITVPLNDTAKTALEQYTGIMREAAEKYIKREINIDEYAQYERNTRNSGLLDTLAQEIGVAYLYKIGALN